MQTSVYPSNFSVSYIFKTKIILACNVIYLVVNTILKESKLCLQPVCQSYVNCVDHGVVNKRNIFFFHLREKKSLERTLAAVQIFKKQNKMFII